jgi:hypothetical protein
VGAAPAPTTLVLLDTNAYLRLAKRVRPMLGVPFGQKRYVLSILQDVEAEVHASPRLRFRYPWFDTDGALVQERLARRLRLSRDEREQIDAAADVLLDAVRRDPMRWMQGGGSPPGPTDCRVLALGLVKGAIVATDDLGMHRLATEFDLSVWHGWELLAKLRSAKVASDELVREVFAALEVNDDLPASWRDARLKAFAKVFR